MSSNKSFIVRIKEKISEIYEKIFANYIKSLFAKPVEILFLGLDFAGKTTLVKKLKYNVNETNAPTRHPQSTQVEIGNLKANVQDMGGHDAARMVWDRYYNTCDGIVFIVDTADTKRFPLVKEVFQSIRDNGKKVPIAVLMNKIDKYRTDSQFSWNDKDWAVWGDSICEQTSIYDEPIESGQPVSVSFVSITNKETDVSTGPLALAFKWLESMIDLKKRNKI